MKEPEKEYFIGGPCAGSVTSEWTTAGIEGATYRLCKLPGERYVKVHSDYAHDEDWTAALLYGYEQHCKAVTERNKPQATEVHTWGPIKEMTITDIHCADTSVMQKELQDSYTASFLRSCKTVILANPFNASPMPLTLSYGKHHLGEINDSLEFIPRGESNENCGRITVIAIIP